MEVGPVVLRTAAGVRAHCSAVRPSTVITDWGGRLLHSAVVITARVLASYQLIRYLDRYRIRNGYEGKGIEEKDFYFFLMRI